MPSPPHSLAKPLEQQVPEHEHTYNGDYPAQQEVTQRAPLTEPSRELHIAALMEPRYQIGIVYAHRGVCLLLAVLLNGKGYLAVFYLYLLHVPLFKAVQKKAVIGVPDSCLCQLGHDYGVEYHQQHQAYHYVYRILLTRIFFFIHVNSSPTSSMTKL